MKRNKIISLVLAATIAVTALTACGTGVAPKESSSVASSESTAASSEAQSAVDSTESKDTSITLPLEETMTFSGLALVVNSQYPLSENVTFKYFQEQANVEFELTELEASEAVEKANLILAGGDYPEFLYKLSGLDLNSYGESGVLIPLEDLIREYAPNLCAILDERDGWNSLKHADGHIYSLPGIMMGMVYGVSDSIFHINKAWLDNLGMQEPTNMDELYQVLKAFKEQDVNKNGDPDDEIPISFKIGSNLPAFLSWIGDVKYMTGTHMAITGENDENIIFYPFEEGYYDWLNTMAKWYKEGLIEQEIFTLTQEQWDAKAQAGNIYGVIFNNKTQVPEEYLTDYTALMPFNEENLLRTNGISGGAFAITDACEHPEVLMAWVDQMYTEYGGTMARYGIENDTWKWVEEDGVTYFYDMKVEETPYENGSQYCLSGKATFPGYIPDYVYSEKYTDNEVLRDALKQKLHLTSTNAKFTEWGLYSKGSIAPEVLFTKEESDRLSTLRTDVCGYVNTYQAQVVAGELSLEDSWEEFQKTLKAMGAEELETIYQTAYDRSVLNK